jgi:hypothetical protein
MIDGDVVKARWIVRIWNCCSIGSGFVDVSCPSGS